MTFKVLVRKNVTIEASRIFSYREVERPGSGEIFVKSLSKAYREIGTNPFRFPVRKGEYRHYLIRRLKYRVVFRVIGDMVFVMQIRHMSQKPSKRYGP